MKGSGLVRLRAPMVLCWGIVLVFLGACATTEPQRGVSFEGEMRAQMTRCSEKYGYDPEKAEGLGEHELGTHEKEWRACVYEGIRTVIIPKSPVPDMYVNLIAHDRTATDSIEKGKMTRSQRKAKNVALMIEIREKEEAIGAQRRAEKEEEVRATMKEKAQLDMRREFNMQPQDSLMRGLGR